MNVLPTLQYVTRMQCVSTLWAVRSVSASLAIKEMEPLAQVGTEVVFIDVCYYIVLICKEINECFEGLDMCASNATCTNTEGDYNCSCDTGYNGDGFTCDSK